MNKSAKRDDAMGDRPCLYHIMEEIVIIKCCDKGTAKQVF